MVITRNKDGSWSAFPGSWASALLSMPNHWRGASDDVSDDQETLSGNGGEKICCQLKM